MYPAMHYPACRTVNMVVDDLSGETTTRILPCGSQTEAERTSLRILRCFWKILEGRIHSRRLVMTPSHKEDIAPCRSPSKIQHGEEDLVHMCCQHKTKGARSFPDQVRGSSLLTSSQYLQRTAVPHVLLNVTHV